MNYPRLVIAATHSGTGKTTVTQGIYHAFSKQGLKVQPFKTGPDYVDLRQTPEGTNYGCCTLDTMLVSKNRIMELFEVNSCSADISIIEGLGGLFDGVGGSDERGSTAHLAKILKAPILLVMDVNAMGRSAGALAYGFTRYERNIFIAGFILNKVADREHYEVVKEAVEGKTGLPVFGYLTKDDDLFYNDQEEDGPIELRRKGKKRTQKLERLIESHVDIEEIRQIACRSEPLPRFSRNLFLATNEPIPVRIAYACDDAFHLYYNSNLRLLRQLGAELVPFSPLKEKYLPKGIDGIYIGEGYPDRYAKVLEANRTMRHNIAEEAEGGRVVYAECGGFEYLTQSLTTNKGETYEMAGIFPCAVGPGPDKKIAGYYQGELINRSPFGKKGKRIKGYIKRMTRIQEYPQNSDRNLSLRLPGRESLVDGFIKGNAVGGYLRIHFASDPTWAVNFMNACVETRTQKRQLQK